jgi:hypothetical protein
VSLPSSLATECLSADEYIGLRGWLPLYGPSMASKPHAGSTALKLLRKVCRAR